MWWKNFRTRKLQTAIMFLIIMLCSTLLTASFGIITSLDEPFDQLIQDCKMATIHLHTRELEPDAVSQVKARFETLESVERVEQIKQYPVTEDLYSQGRKIDAYSGLYEFKEGIWDSVYFEEGDINTLRSLTNGECAIALCIYNENQLSLGDTITIKLSQGEKKYVIKAVYASPYDSMTSYDSGIIVNEIPSDLKTRSILCIYGKNDATASQIESEYRSNNEGKLEGAIVTIDSMKAGNKLLGNITGSIFLAIGIIMLLVSSLIINFMIRNRMIADAKTIAVYKTLGYASNDILKMYLIFYFVVVSAGCILGIGMARVLKDFILSNMFRNIGKASSQNIFVIGIPCYLCIVCFVLLIIYSIIRKTKQVKPVIALNGMTHSNTKKKHYHGNSEMQFSSFGIAVRTMRSDRKGMIGVLIISIMTIFSVNFGIISLDVANTLKQENDFWIGIDKSDILITVSNEENLKKVQDILEKETEVEQYLYSNLNYGVSLDWKEGITDTYMYMFVYDDFTTTKLPIAKGRNPQNSGEIAIASVIADQYDKTVGDYLMITFPNQTRINLLITGIFQTYFNLGHAGRILTSTLTEHEVDFNYDSISVYLKDDIDAEVYLSQLSELVGAAGSVILRTEAFASIMNMIQQPQQMAIPYVMGLVFLIGGVNIFSVVLLRNAKNEMIYGIYKSIGYTSGHLIRSNLIYVSILATVAMAIALPFILFTYPLIMKLTLSMFNFISYPVKYNALHIGYTNSIVFFVFLLFTYVSSLSIKKVSVRKLVVE